MTAATTAVAVSQAAVFGAIGVIVLYNIIGLLIAKELLLLSASGTEKAKRFGRVASVAIVWSGCGAREIYIGDNIKSVWI